MNKYIINRKAGKLEQIPEVGKDYGDRLHEFKKRLLDEISRMNNTDEDVWTGNEVKQHLINFILKME